MQLKGWTSSVLAAAVLAGCGGSSDSVNNTPATPPVTTQPGTTPPTTTPPTTTPSLTVQSGTLTRVIASGGAINLAVTAQAANFTPAGTLYATVSDSGGVLQAPVQVTAGADGRYSFSLDTVSTLSAGRYQGSATVKLCSDQACTTAQAVPSISVPYDFIVLSANSAWPGDKLTALSAMAGAADWTTFQGNNARTGYVPVEVKADAIALRWKRGGINSGASSSSAPTPLVAANGLFYANDNGRLSAYRETDGSSAWSYAFTSSSLYAASNIPAIADGAVYLAAAQQDGSYMFAFDAATGAVRFRARMNSSGDRGQSPVVQDGVVYASAGSYYGIYGFSTSGETLFNNTVTQSSYNTLAGDAKGVYVYTGDALTVLQPRSGEKLTTIRDSAAGSYYYSLTGAPVVGANGVYAATYGSTSSNAGGNFLTRFDTTNKYVDWRISGQYGVTPAYASGVLYALNANPLRLEARAEKDGALQWSWTPQLSSETGFYGAPVVTRNLLFVSTNRATYAIDLVSHKTVWSYPMAGNLAISQNGVLYIQGVDAVVAVNLK